MSSIVVLQQMVIIFILVMIGYLLYKKHILGDGASSAFSSLVIHVCNPALLIGSCFDRDPSVTNENLLWAFAAGAVVFGLLIIFSFVLPRLLRVEEKIKNHYAMMCIFGNTGFIGIPLLKAVMGDSVLIYAVIINIYYTLLFYTYGYYLAGGKNSRFQAKNLLNAGNVSLVIAIIVFLWQPKVPTMIQSAITYVSNATTFLAMTVIGISLARTNLKPIFTQVRLYLFVALRFILIPILISVVLRLFIKDDLLYGACVLLSAVPVGNLPLMRVEEEGGDGTVLSQGIILSTILSVVTIPIVTLFM
jgi:predicted permease